MKCIGTLRIKNRIGAVASKDTSSRLATEVVTNWLKHGVKKPGMLTVVSTDNIDILQSHAAVSTSCSWHGTSVYACNPYH